MLEFDRRAKLHRDMNAVLDAGDKPGIQRQNILRDYFTRRSLVTLLKPERTDFVLDFGCGMGRLTHYLKPWVSRIAGVDVSAGMLDLARKEDTLVPPVEFTLMSGSMIPHPDRSFDKVFSVWVLQHIHDEDLNVLAREIYRVLKPGGIMVSLEQTRKEKKTLSDIHIHRSVNDYCSVFERSGFETISSKAAMRVPSYSMSYWNHYGFLSRSWLPALYFLEKSTLHWKENNVEYFTWSFVFKK